ncbi:MAG: malto-oligosyltrehalose trehalohydrolase [Rhodospirillales bacterium]
MTGTRRAHAMPFGAGVLEDGRTRFRIWAPAARSMSVRLPDRTLPMSAAGGGWHETVSDAAPAGTRYRYVVDGGTEVPDPAARFQPDDVHGASEVIDPRAYAWSDGAWRGRPWHETVLYELHVGTFTAEGSYAGVAARLDHLAELGITAIELMPLADAPGTRNWGYDGVCLYAPEARYGRPEDLKALVDAAHSRGLMVFLDVVYNHFGPEGNYLSQTAPGFFTERHHTPWGAAINFDGDDSAPVRDFFVHNALYWIEEYHFDGLRLDAVHAIVDDSHPHILTEIAESVRSAIPSDRHVHLVLENDDNAARFLRRDAEGRPRWYDAQWNDDLHHVLHCAITGESAGYYTDYTDHTADRIGRCLAEGFDYQGEPSRHRGGARRGEPSAALPPTAFVGFLQNHDQVGNRAFGDRIDRLAPPPAVLAATAICLLAPSPPMLFMGEEWAAAQPFPFFCDFGPELAEAVRQGRRREFERFPEFADPAARARIPDPQDEATFARAVLDWSARDREPHRGRLAYTRALLRIRAEEIVPRLRGIAGDQPGWRVDGGALRVEWRLGDGSRLHLLANLTDAACPITAPLPDGRTIFATPATATAGRALPPWSAIWLLDG